MKNYSTGGADWLDMDDKIPANSTSYTVRYLAPAVTYGFQLAAVNEAGHSNWEAKNLTMPADGKLHGTLREIFETFHKAADFLRIFLPLLLNRRNIYIIIS